MHAPCWKEGNTILPETVFDDLLDFLHNVYDLFDEATKTTIKTHDDESTLLENSPYSVEVRSKVKHGLKELCSQYQFSFRTPNFRRIHLIFPKYEMRIMRAKDDSLFDSKYNFHQPFLFKELNTNKLILRWGVSTSGTFLGLELGMPRGDNYYWPRLVWQVFVPPPTQRHLR